MELCQRTWCYRGTFKGLRGPSSLICGCKGTTIPQTGKTLYNFFWKKIENNKSHTLLYIPPPPNLPEGRRTLKDLPWASLVGRGVLKDPPWPSLVGRGILSIEHCGSKFFILHSSLIINHSLEGEGRERVLFPNPYSPSPRGGREGVQCSIFITFGLKAEFGEFARRIQGVCTHNSPRIQSLQNLSAVNRSSLSCPYRSSPPQRWASRMHHHNHLQARSLSRLLCLFMPIFDVVVVGSFLFFI